MKKIKLVVIATVFMLIAVSCKRGNSIRSSNGSDYLEINYWGDVRFSDDEKSIQSITPDGYLRFRKNDKQLLAESNFHGEVTYEISYKGSKLDASSNNGKRFIAEIIQEMIANGFDAKGRLSRLYKDGGSRAILDEVSEMKSDHMKSMYLAYLLSSNSLSEDELLETAKKIFSVRADYDKAGLLKKFSTAYAKNDRTSKAWLEAVASIGADFEKANALRSLLHEPLTDEQIDQVLSATKIINTEFEKVNILKQLIAKRTYTLEGFDKMLEAIDNIGSDVDKVNLLKQLVEAGIPADECFDNLLDVVDHFGAGLDKTTMLTYLIKRDIRSEKQWIGLIDATGKLSSDLDKTNLLVSISHKMPKSENLIANYMIIAKTIASDIDYRRAVKEVE